MSEPLSGAFRQSVEAWEREAAAYWDGLSRSPEFLTRVGFQLHETLRSQQRVTSALQSAAWNAAVAQQQGSRERYLLERLQTQIDELSARLDRLEQHLGDG